VNRPKLRKTNKKKKVLRAEKEMAQKMNMFDKIPNACMSCDKDFDRKDKDMIMSWTVVVRKEQEQVNLWCPECWVRARETLTDMQERFKKNDEVQPG
jgi:hypothetical protein